MEELLIEKVREHDFLYNSWSRNYRDQRIRLEAWQEIGKELKITGEAAKNSWDKLRRCYLNARNRRRTKNSGDAVKNIHSWKFEAQMSFLLPFIDNKKTQTNVSDNYEIFMNDIQFADEVDKQGSSQDDTTILQDEEKEQELNKNVDANMQNDTTSNNDIEVSSYLQNKRYKLATLRKRKFEEKRKNTAVSKMDETDMFFMSMSKMTKRLPQIEQAKIKLQLSNAVLKAQIKLSENQQQLESTRCSSRHSETHSISSLSS